MTGRIVVSIVTGLALIGLWPALNSAAATDRIAVLVSANEAPYKETVSAFSSYLAQQGIRADYEMLPLDGDAAKAQAAVQKVRAEGARLVFAVGSLATDAVIRGITDVPIVASLIVRTEGLKKNGNATGVGLEFQLETQFEWMQRILPNAKSIGVMYNPAENQKRIEAAGRLARKAGLRLEAEEVEAPQDVPAALNSLSRRADLLWGIADNLTLSPQIAKNVLLFSFRNNIPFVGPSATWVKAGALYSLDWDYADLGAQCGEMALKILQGAAPNTIAPAAPRKVLYTLNLFTANQMKIVIPDQVVRGAKQVF